MYNISLTKIFPHTGSAFRQPELFAVIASECEAISKKLSSDNYLGSLS
ncbi:MAG: hypothetical protein J6U05_07990 [Neisseriaceae bacterium]|nr:hypothetical protein [Neisseriaceae bacterium]